MNTNRQTFLPETVQAVWIDVDQTLLDFDACAKDALIGAFERYGYEWKEEYFSVFLRENAKLWDQIEEGKLDRPALRKIRFPIIFREFGLPLEDPVGFEAAFSDILHHGHVPMKDSLEGLQLLASGGIPVFAATNGPLEGQTRRLSLAGMLEYIEDVFASQSFGAAKPSQVFFLKTLQETCRIMQKELRPEQILMIGDSWKADISGAVEFGCRCIWLRENRQYDPFAADPLQHVTEAENWKEIIELLKHGL